MGAAMGKRAAVILVGIAVVGLPALEWQIAAAKPVATGAHKAAHKSEGKRSGRRAAKGPPAAEILNAYAALPEAERLAILADLAWIGGYEAEGSGEFDARAIAVIKAFQKRNNGKDTGILTPAERELLATEAQSRGESVGWKLIEDPATGASLGLPAKLVPQAGASRSGSSWSSAQGQIRIETFRLAEAALPALFEDEKKASQRRITSSALKSDSFTISGTQGLKNFLERAEARGSEVRGITILYDQATKGIMGEVAVATASAFHGFPDLAAPPPGMRRSVEYGTAIIVSSTGDLIASSRVTDECQAITVPGLGHADRASADKTNELALLRLYGARNLVPAMPASGSGAGGDVTLVGIADPLAQAGGGAVSRVPARLNGQAVDPPPKLGFSGAAAVDAQGRFVGMVALKPPVVAGSASAAHQASLVSADAIRTFLQAHGVEPAAPPARGAIEQSVVRVICVRK